MTSNDLPPYIIGLFENQINIIKINLLTQISIDYKLDKDKLIEEYSCPIEIISKKLENIKIVKTNNYNINIADDMKCFARVWNNGKGARCKKTKHIDNLCTLHYNKLQKEGNLKYGYINEKRPIGIFKYKNPKRETLY
jgi:hypothetical protein